MIAVLFTGPKYCSGPYLQVTLLQESLLQYKDGFFISIHKMNACLHLRKLVNALHPQPLGMQSLYLCLHKLWSVKMQPLTVLTA